MPKFMYSIFVITSALTAVLVSWLVFKDPRDSLLNIFVMLVLLFFTLAFFVSIPVFFILVRRNRHVGLEKETYQRSLKLGLYISLCLTGSLALKAFKLVNPLNFGLFAVLCAAILPFFIRRK